ncbi:glycosyl transferase family 90-domain-containing protein [Phaeosphaeriaceae sp. PMI808]|nr:glycosyl transferase family 90-domain-containing protein [Phaeosphaeriaceae sp. PMI808]
MFLTILLLRNRFDIHLSQEPSKSHLVPEPPKPPEAICQVPAPIQILEDAIVDEQFRISSKSDYSFSPEKCNTKFADLFREIDRSVALQKSIGNVTPTDIDLAWKPYGAVRVMIYNQKLYVIEVKYDGKGYHKPRLLAILHQIHRAITFSPLPLPSIEFSFAVDDIADDSHDQHTIWAFSRHISLDNSTWVMPDFGYWSWPLELVGEYEQIRKQIRDNEVSWQQKVPMVFWRGALKTNMPLRSALIRVTKGKAWADVKEVIWKSRTEVSKKSSQLPIAEHCRYQFLIHTEGRSYSGRGKYLLNCGSVVIRHKAEWVEPHSHLFMLSGPHQNVVEVERDFSDLKEKVGRLLRDPQRAQAIANNSINTFRDRYLTPAAEACYWRQLFLSWADVSFQPDPWLVHENGRRKMRGIPFETFV